MPYSVTSFFPKIYFLQKIRSIAFYPQNSCTSGHRVQMFLFSCIRGNLPAFKGFIYLCLFCDLQVVQMFHILFHIKGIFLVIIGQLFVPLVLRYIEFIREKWSDTSKLHNTFPAIHDSNLILAHQFLSGLLVIQTVGLARPPRIRGVVQVNGFFPQYLC